MMMKKAEKLKRDEMDKESKLDDGAEVRPSERCFEKPPTDRKRSTVCVDVKGCVYVARVRAESAQSFHPSDGWMQGRMLLPIVACRRRSQKLPGHRSTTDGNLHISIHRAEIRKRFQVREKVHTQGEQRCLDRVQTRESVYPIHDTPKKAQLSEGKPRSAPAGGLILMSFLSVHQNNEEHGMHPSQMKSIVEKALRECEKHLLNRPRSAIVVRQPSKSPESLKSAFVCPKPRRLFRQESLTPSVDVSADTWQTFRRSQRTPVASSQKKKTLDRRLIRNANRTDGEVDSERT
uniref:Uncharacterized protein n=1 Tax=Panagrellus redivivus TaxID=6233 RepID=A0A7E4ULK6_PANRE